jgi:hypothetical protein
MSDLALLVAAIFLLVVVSGPLAVLFARSGFPVLGCILGALAMLSGWHWTSVAPWGVNLLGLTSAILGLLAVYWALAGNKG